MGKTYASTDWHGCGELADQIFDYLQPDDTLYFLGDAIDRGKDGIYIFDKLYNDKRVKMLLGNHENMMAQCLPYLIQKRNIVLTMGWTDVNGGSSTWESLKDKNEDDIIDYIIKINSLPLQLTYINKNNDIIIMEHAGFTPGTPAYRKHDPLWDRKHFYDSWPEKDFRGNYKDMSKVYMVHGHTSVPELKYYQGYIDNEPLTLKEKKNAILWEKGKSYEKPTILKYCNGHKIDIDMESHFSGRAVLLDLDTFEEIYFDIKGEQDV